MRNVNDNSDATPPDARRQSSKYRIRYSLRGLLLAMLACGAAAGVWSTFVEPFRRQANGIKAVKEAGGLFTSVGAGDHTLQKWLVTVSLGRDAYCQVTSVRFNESPIRANSPFVLRQIGQMQHLESLELDNSIIDDGAISGIAGMQKLKSLSLRYTRVDDEAFHVASTLPSLESLKLTGTKVTDLGMPKLHELESLRELYLRWTYVTSEAVSALKTENPDCEVYIHTLAQ